MPPRFTLLNLCWEHVACCKNEFFDTKDSEPLLCPLPLPPHMSPGRCVHKGHMPLDPENPTAPGDRLCRTGCCLPRPVLGPCGRQPQPASEASCLLPLCPNPTHHSTDTQGPPPPRECGQKRSTWPSQPAATLSCGMSGWAPQEWREACDRG